MTRGGCMEGVKVLECLKSLSHELREIDVGSHVPRIHISAMDAMTFASEYVARNRPCVIQGALDAWPALERWTEQYLRDKAGPQLVTVDVTPDGRGDAVTPCLVKGGPLQGDQEVQCFVTPDERKMTLEEFFVLLRASRSTHKEVPYVQHQNNSLASEFGMLEEDLQPALEWAHQVFGGVPEATNLWIGDERSVTSFHKDHYENLYAVLVGTKIFTLLPPCEMWRMHMKQYPAARWVQQQPHQAGPGPDPVDPDLVPAPSAANCGIDSAGSSSTNRQEGCQSRPWTTVDIAATSTGQDPCTVMRAVLKEPREDVPWCAIDPKPEDLEAATRDFPLFFDSSLPEPLVTEVGPGDLLFLPSMWWHHVEQRATSPDKDYVVAVNYWYDMKFDAKWAYYKLVESLATGLGLSPDMGQQTSATPNSD